MEFAIIILSATTWLLTNTPLFQAVWGNNAVLERSYRQRLCGDNSTKYITHGSSVGVNTARTLIDCVAKCQREEMCNYAVFEKTPNEKYGLCHMIFSIFKNNNGSSTLLSEEIISPGNESHCLVASGLIKPMWDMIRSSNIKKLELLPTLTPVKVALNNRFNIEDVSEMKVTKDRIAVARISQKILVYSVAGTQRLPIRIKVARISSTPEVLLQLLDYPQFDGSVEGSKLSEKDPSFMDILAKTTYESVDGFPNVIIASTIDDVILCLQRGYRRLVKHPAIVRIDMTNKQVEFDMNGVVRANFDLQEYMPVPIYYVKDRVSDNFGERYFIPFFYNSRMTLPVEMLPTSLPWIFDNNWDELLPTDGSSLYSTLEKVVLQGWELRVLVDGELSADLTTVVVIPNGDIIATLAHETIPTNREEPGSNITTLKSRFTAISANRLKLVCSYLVHDSILRETESSRLSQGSIQWFTSKQVWEKKLVVDKRKQVVFGDVGNLISIAQSGKTIRVCVVKTTNVVLCLTPTSITIPTLNSKSILVQSMPFYDPEAMYQGAQQYSSSHSLPNHACRRVHLTITSFGFVKKQDVIFGTIAQPTDVEVPFNRIDWFVEMA